MTALWLREKELGQLLGRRQLKPPSLSIPNYWIGANGSQGGFQGSFVDCFETKKLVKMSPRRARKAPNNIGQARRKHKEQLPDARVSVSLVFRAHRTQQFGTGGHGSINANEGDTLVLMPLPAFNDDGNLPQGIHTADWDEFQVCFGTSERRTRLLSGLELGLRSLYEAGCTQVYVDGSFVTTKDEPGDFDACWEQRDVPDLDAIPAIFFRRRNQKERFGGEFFLATRETIQTYLEFFQTDRNGRPKGIVLLELENVFSVAPTEGK